MNWVDPTGKFSLAELNVTTAIVGVLATLVIAKVAQNSATSVNSEGFLALMIDKTLDSAFQGIKRTVEVGLDDFTEVLMFEGALASAKSIARNQVKEALKRNNGYDLVQMMPTLLSKSDAKQFPGLEDNSGRGEYRQRVGRDYVLLFGGGNGRVFGYYLAEKGSGKLAVWIIRVDYHSVRSLRPNARITLHYHIEPNMDYHHFLYP